MEILNKNQRRSALQRMLMLGAVVLGLIGLLVANTHHQYINQDKDRIEQLERELVDTRNRLMGEVSTYKKEKERLDKELQACRAARGEEDPRIAELQREIKTLEDKMEILEDKKELCDDKLADCKDKLAAAKSFNGG